MSSFIHIHLINPRQVYTSQMGIKGVVKICSEKVIPFEALRITLDGTAHTTTYQLSFTGPSTRCHGKHVFLRLQMPNCHLNYPKSRIFEPSMVYEFPFSFVVPSSLLETACQHDTIGNCLHDDHTQPPPSMNCESGDETLGPSTSAVARVQYTIKASVMARNVPESNHHNKEEPIIQASRIVNVVPESVEWPPLTFDLINNDYTLQKKKQFRKYILFGESGVLTIASIQPEAIVVLPSHPHIAPSSTRVLLTLCFHSTGKKDQPSLFQPPRIKRLRSSLRSSTFYSTRPHRTVPSRASLLGSVGNINNTRLSEKRYRLEDRDVAGLLWVKENCARGTSAPCPCLFPAHELPRPMNGLAPSTTQMQENRSTSLYTMSVTVPIALPPAETWLPTFHSCLISHVHTLDVTISFLPSIPSQDSLSLSLPVQIMAKSNTPLSHLRTATHEYDLSGGRTSNRLGLQDGDLESGDTEPPTYRS